MEIYYVTSNKAKFDEASHILDLERLRSFGITIIQTPFPLVEIQGTKEEIALYKINQAVQHFKKPCIIDDVSLYCPSLGGLPGPYIRSFLEALGDEKFATLLSQYEDRSCTVSCTVAYAPSPELPPMLFEGTIEGHIVLPRGARKHQHSWNAIVEPLGRTTTYAEISLEQMSRESPRSKALVAFQNYLLSEYP